MMRPIRVHRARALSMMVVAALCGVATTGCVVVDGTTTADMEVGWTIDRVDAASLCDVYGIESWVVEVRGPESIDVPVDCRAEDWVTGNALYDILEGAYTVDVVALDAGGFELASIGTTVDLLFDGSLNTVDKSIDVDFTDSDFP